MLLMFGPLGTVSCRSRFFEIGKIQFPSNELVPPVVGSGDPFLGVPIGGFIGMREVVCNAFCVFKLHA